MQNKINFWSASCRVAYVAMLILMLAATGKVYGQNAEAAALPTISFAPGASTLSPDAVSQLSRLTDVINSHPGTKIITSGNGGSTKIDQQLAWERVNTVIDYLTDKAGIDRSRFIFNAEASQVGSSDVDLRFANPGEDGPNKVPPPHPGMTR